MSTSLVTELERLANALEVDGGAPVEIPLASVSEKIAKELEASSRSQHLICDRAVLDNYCYLVNKFGRQPQLEQWLGWWMESYSLLVSVPPMADGIPPDGFRSENLEFQERIHDLIGEMLAEPQFAAHHDRVLWLDRRDRRVWGEMIFASAGPLLRPAIRAQAAAAR